jgi:uncharacterized protein YjdB
MMRHSVVSYAVLLALLCAGCGDAISPSVPASIEIVDPPAQVIEGRRAVLEPRVVDSNGTLITAPHLDWYSSNPLAAAVSFEGEVSAVAAGTTTITAQAGTVAASAVVEVILAPVDTVALDVSTGYVSVGGVHGVELYAWTVDGRVKNRQVEWSISDTTLATIRVTGLVTAEVFGRKPGNVVVTGTLGGKSASAPMGVELR